MNDKLLVIKEIKLFINRYEDLVFNVDNKYKVLKNMIINKMYFMLEDACYCNLLEKNKRINYQEEYYVILNFLIIIFINYFVLSVLIVIIIIKLAVI